MIANYHTHTPRCFHASGSEEEYIQSAMQAGLQILGFSDHTPQPFKDGYYSKMRMYPYQLTEYVQTLRTLQQRYAGQLQIHIGLETEYYPACFGELLNWVRGEGIEYMILGQHWLGNEQGETHVYHCFCDEGQLIRYVDQSIDAMQTGAFSYFAHPDLASFVGDEKFYESQMRRLIREANACGMPLEINLHGLRCGCSYPDVRFWKLAAEEGAQVVFGRDAHAPAELLETETLEQMKDMVLSMGLNLRQKVDLVRP